MSGPTIRDQIAKVPLHDRVQAIISGTVELSALADDHVAPMIPTLLHPKPFEQAISASYYRMVTWMRSLVKLDSPLDIQPVSAGARGMFELLIDIVDLTRDHALAEKYIAFNGVESFKAMTKYVKFCDKYFPTDPTRAAQERAHVSDPKNIAQDELLRTTHWGQKNGKPIQPTSWLNLDLGTRASTAGVQYEEIYRFSQARLSWFVHSGAVGIPAFNADKGLSVFGWSHSIAQNAFADATERVGKEFHFFDASPELRRRLKEAKDTTGQALIDASKAAGEL